MKIVRYIEPQINVKHRKIKENILQRAAIIYKTKIQLNTRERVKNVEKLYKLNGKNLITKKKMLSEKERERETGKRK